MNDDKQCPECGGKLRIRTSRAITERLMQKRRECNACAYRDVAYFEPAKLLRLLVVSTTNGFPQDDPDGDNSNMRGINQ
ncbi:hypothetical protein [Aeoliella sp. SH292]|uniref:hypothetical protein n=1 Tax=Aeoliella sp. SH292 TaxID=3454464 RepID=UPI003F982E3A